MGANDQALQAALSWETESAVPEDKSTWVWLWEAIQGDFNQDRSGGQIAFDMAVSMVPLVDQVCDVRDIIANCKAIYYADEQAERTGEPVDTSWLYVSLGLTLIGLFPTLGSLVKGVLKLFFVFIRRHGLEHLIRAVEEGMTWVVTYLRKREVQKYISAKHIDEVFKWLADQIREVRGKLSASALLANFDRGIEIMKGLLAKVDWMPGDIGERARKAIKVVESIRKRADAPLANALGPMRKTLDAIITRLEFENLLIRRGIVDVHNVHFRGGLPESRAVALMRDAEPPPKWLSKGRDLEFPGLDPRERKTLKEIEKRRAEGWPDITNNVSSFHKMEAAEIVGPAKLYRVVSPSNGAMGDCWVSQAVWDMIQKSPDPKAAWRKHLGVWPDWNPNGQFVVMDIPPGESVKVWRGPAAGQAKLDDIDLDAHLEGGWEQIVVKGPEEPADTFKFYRRDSDGRLDAPIDYPAFNALSAEEKAAYIGIREKINHPRIRGPLDTTWGYTDFDSQLQDVKIGLPALPGQTLN
ncbi:hypothetical protein [Denitromonas sp.]|uniref:hypothetical protein n=1 Tax=Denitromonas sp. TaxID=2734609 RepID=UPI002AFE90C7|nr:hypothetical protein [Denitromonas sp.]